MSGYLSVTRLIAESQYWGGRFGVSKVRKVISEVAPEEDVDFFESLSSPTEQPARARARAVNATVSRVLRMAGWTSMEGGLEPPVPDRRAWSVSVHVNAHGRVSSLREKVSIVWP